MESEEIKQLLVKYITGEADEKDTVRINQWINAHPENELYFVELYEAWQNLLQLRPDFIDDEAAYQRFAKKTQPLAKSNIRLVHWYAIAASVILFGAAGWWLMNRQADQNKIETRQIAARRGNIKKLTLSDGTLVWLNAASTLTYPADFGKVTRTVYLDGEALFDIAPGHKNIPFVVHTKNYVIHDIGTRFNLKSYKSDSSFEAAVIKGEVSVESKINNGDSETNRIFLKQNQVLKILNRSSALGHLLKTGSNGVLGARVLNDIQVQQVAATQLDQYEGWTENELVFDNKPLIEIARVLERRYDINIILQDSELQNTRYTGCFKNIDNIEGVLHMIQENTPITFSRKGNNMMITKTK